MSRATEVLALSTRLSRLPTSPPEETALLGFFAGVVYALKRAADLGYDDDRASGSPDDFDQEYHRVLNSIVEDQLIDDDWLSGFFLNDALMRIAALGDRINKYRGVNEDLARTVRKTVNKLKHEVDPHLRKGLPVKYDDVLGAAKNLTKAFEDHLVSHGIK